MNAVTIYADIDGCISPIMRQSDDVGPGKPRFELDEWPEWGSFNIGQRATPHVPVMESAFPVARGLVAALGELRREGARLVWSSSWAVLPDNIESGMALVEEAFGLPGALTGGEFVSWDRGSRNPKLAGVLNDQLSRPGPFVWFDDDGQRGYGGSPGVFDGLRKYVGDTPHLLIEPNAHAGLTPDDVAGMRAFVAQHAS